MMQRPKPLQPLSLSTQAGRDLAALRLVGTQAGWDLAALRLVGTQAGRHSGWSGPSSTQASSTQASSTQASSTQAGQDLAALRLAALRLVRFWLDNFCGQRLCNVTVALPCTTTAALIKCAARMYDMQHACHCVVWRAACVVCSMRGVQHACWNVVSAYIGTYICTHPNI